MKITLLILAAFITLQTIGQKKEDIAHEVTKMVKATNQSDYEKVMDYTYPVIFDLAPREMLVGIMKESMDNDMMKISFEDIEINASVSDLVEINDGFYALVTFPSVMKMTFKTEMPNEQIDMIKESMKTNMNAESVEFHQASNTIKISMVSQTIAAFDKFTDRKSVV